MKMELVHQAERTAELEVISQVRENIPAAAFEMILEELNFTERITNLLVEAGYETIGDLMLQLEMDSDAILGLNGIGPKAMENIQNSVSEVTFPEPIVEEVEEEGEIAAAEEEVEAEVAEGEDIVVEPEADEAQPEEVLEAAEVAEEVEAAVDQEVTGEEAEPVLEQETEASFEEIFALEPDAFDIDLAETEFEDEADSEEEERKKKKQKKKKYVEMEYDPDQDVVIVKRKRKRDEEDWEEDWEY